jgi:replicative DNA helicase
MITETRISTTNQQPTITRFNDLLPQWKELAASRHEAFTTNTIHGPELPSFPELARNVGGTLRPGFHVLHGQPGSGKTAFALQIAGESRVNALYVTSEMASLELVDRTIARTTKTSLSMIKSGKLSPAQMNELALRAAAAVPGLAFVDGTVTPVRPDWLINAASSLKGDAKHMLVVVDSVHSWAEGYMSPGANEYEVLGGAVASLRKLAQQLDCPVLGIAERNRAAMDKGGMAASAGSRKFEYGSETVLDLSRGADGPDEEVTVTLAIQKNRNGGTSENVHLLFDGSHQEFMELS